jgi:fibronectin-binding autotransporter adhesin
MRNCASPGVSRTRNHQVSRRLIAVAAAVATGGLVGPGTAWAANPGVFSSTNYTSASQMTDTNVGLNSAETYQNASDINGAALTINGVSFAAGGLTSGTNWGLSGAGNSFTTNTTAGGNNNIATSNQLYTLETTFTYNGNPAVFTLNGLTTGQAYTLTYYDVGFGTAGGRVMSSIAGSDGGSITNYDENASGAGNGSLLRYTFEASSASESLSFTPASSGNTFQFYGFSNEQVFNNTFSSASGSNWSTATYSVPTLAPTAGAGGTNVIFPQQASAATVNLDTSETVGHVQFASTNNWTISSTGSSTLTFQGDPGGVSVLSATAGTNTIAVPITLNNGLVKYGAGTVVFTKAITSNGNSLTIGSDGGVRFGDGVANLGSTDGPIVDNGVLIFANPTAQTYGGSTAVISGTGNLVESGPGTLTLSGADTFTGTTTVTGGGLLLNNAGALSGSTVTVSSSIQFAAGIGSFTFGGLSGSSAFALQDNGSNPLSLTVGGNNQNATYSGNLSGLSSSVTKVGTGTQVLSGTDTYSGATTVSAGTLEFGQPASLSAATTVSVATGATVAVEVGPSPFYQSSDIDALRTNVAFAANAMLGIDTTNATGGTFTYSSGLANTSAGALGLTKLGTGTLVLGGNNSYSGNTSIQNGTLQLSGASGSSSFTGTTGTLTLGAGTNSGILVLGDASGPVNATFTGLSVSGTGTTNAILGGNSAISTLTINNAATNTYPGTIGGAGTNQNELALVKGGAGTLTLPGAYTYLGSTTLNGGVVQISTLAAGGSASGIGASTNAAANLVFNGGTLQYLGSAAASTDRLFTLAGAGTIDSSGAGTVTFSTTGAEVTTGTTATSLTLQGSNTGANVFAGQLTNNGTNLTSVNKFGAGTWDLTGTSSNYTGVTDFAGGILNVASLANYGVASSIGARLASQDGSANVGILFESGTLQYTGSTPQSTNRQIRDNVTGGTIDASGSSPTATLSFTFNGTNTDFFENPGARSLTFTGTNTGPNTFDQAITDQAASPNITSVYKTGVGTWVLGGNMGTTNGGFNGYTGGTNVQNGTLQLASTGSLNPAGALILGAGTTSGVFVLGDSNGAGNQTFSSLTVSGTGTANSLVAGSTAISTLTVNNASTDAFAGTLGGSGTNQNNLALTKTGAGTLALAPLTAYTYTGPTLLSAGTLSLGAASVAPTGQVAHYTFDNTTNDITTNANNATLNPTGTPTYVAGIRGQAIGLNGTSQYLTVPYSTSLNVTGPYTVSLWEKLNAAETASGSGPALVSTRNGGDTTFDLQIISSGLHADIGTGSAWLNTSANYTSTALATSLNWNMVTYTMTTTGYTVYVNGVQVTSGTYTGTPEFMKSGQTLSLGSQEAGGGSYGNAGYFNGALDEVDIYPTALTAAQVNTLYLANVNTGSVLPVTTPLTVASGATLDVAGNSQTIGSLSDSSPGSGGTVTNSSTYPATLTVSPASGSTTFSGTITDGGTANAITFIKSGLGMQTLAGSSTYSGGTTITAGTLLANNTSGSATGSGSVNITGGTLGGSGTIQLGTGNSANVATGATLAPGIPTATGRTLTITGGSVGFAASAIFAVKTGTPGTNDSLVVTSGTMALASSPSSDTLSVTATTPGTFTIATVSNGGTGTLSGFFGSLVVNGATDSSTLTVTDPTSDETLYSYKDGNSVLYTEGNPTGADSIVLTVNSVPEPASLGLVALGGLGLLKRRRRIV